MITLKSLGWDNFFSEEYNTYKDMGFLPARVSVEHKERYQVLTEKGELKAEVSGRLIYTADNNSDFPKTGDWVAGNIFEDEEKMIIHEVLKRKTKFSRSTAGKKQEEQIIASNIDYLFIMQSMDNNFNLRRLERYLSAALDGRIKPVIILSKADLCSDPDAVTAKAKEISGDIPVHSVSSVMQQGLEEIKKYISDGITIAFAGSSGVGKSTLINLLAGKELLRTAEVREADSRGRHTTTRREMILLPEGGILIDTPGMREFGLWEAEKGIEQVFDEIEELAVQCRFSDCKHLNEAGCAVLAALESGSLTEERYNSYLKLQKEMKYIEQRKDHSAAAEEKRKWKSIHKEMRHFYKLNPKKR